MFHEAHIPVIIETPTLLRRTQRPVSGYGLRCAVAVIKRVVQTKKDFG